MGGIFISYRRDDSAPWAGRLYERLLHDFRREQIFMDVDAIAPGDDFVARLEESVGAADVVLVLIGPGWLAATDRDGRRRLDDPADFVRIEIAAALRRDVRVVPILIEAAQMPRADELPPPLQALSRKQATTLTHQGFGAETRALVAALVPLVKRQLSLPERVRLAAVGRQSEAAPAMPIPATAAVAVDAAVLAPVASMSPQLALLVSFLLSVPIERTVNALVSVWPASAWALSTAVAAPVYACAVIALLFAAVWLLMSRALRPAAVAAWCLAATVHSQSLPGIIAQLEGPIRELDALLAVLALPAVAALVWLNRGGSPRSDDGAFDQSIVWLAMVLLALDAAVYLNGHLKYDLFAADTGTSFGPRRHEWGSLAIGVLAAGISAWLAFRTSSTAAIFYATAAAVALHDAIEALFIGTRLSLFGSGYTRTLASAAIASCLAWALLLSLVARTWPGPMRQNENAAMAALHLSLSILAALVLSTQIANVSDNLITSVWLAILPIAALVLVISAAVTQAADLRHWIRPQTGTERFTYWAGCALVACFALELAFTYARRQWWPDIEREITMLGAALCVLVSSAVALRPRRASARGARS